MQFLAVGQCDDMRKALTGLKEVFLVVEWFVVNDAALTQTWEQAEEEGKTAEKDELVQTCISKVVALKAQMQKETMRDRKHTAIVTMLQHKEEDCNEQALAAVASFEARAATLLNGAYDEGFQEEGAEPGPSLRTVLGGDQSGHPWWDILGRNKTLTL